MKRTRHQFTGFFRCAIHQLVQVSGCGGPRTYECKEDAHAEHEGEQNSRDGQEGDDGALHVERLASVSATNRGASGE